MQHFSTHIKHMWAHLNFNFSLHIHKPFLCVRCQHHVFWQQCNLQFTLPANYFWVHGRKRKLWKLKWDLVLLSPYKKATHHYHKWTAHLCHKWTTPLANLWQINYTPLLKLSQVNSAPRFLVKILNKQVYTVLRKYATLV